MLRTLTLIGLILSVSACNDATPGSDLNDGITAEESALDPPPAVADSVVAAASLTAEEAAERALGEGDRAPSFDLVSATRGRVDLQTLLANGPVVLTFYRGAWCPYCNTELRALQAALPEIEQAGASLVAVSPQLPDGSITMRDKQSLTYPVLSDPGNQLARQYGIVFTVGEEVAERYRLSGIDLEASNGDASYELPIPATYVIDTSGVIRYAFVDADYKVRADPGEVIAALRSL